MLLLSLIVHASTAGTIALFSFHGEATPVLASREAMTPSETVILLRSVESPGIENRQPDSIKPAARLITLNSPVTPSTAQLQLGNASRASTAISPPSLALEANPNAHVRSFPPGAILSPSPAPRLNGADGVVFILDLSGSMYEPYAGSCRLAFARQTLSRRILALQDGKPFAITLYGRRARNSGPLVAANDATREAAVRFIMGNVDLGGGTNLPAGLASAEQLHPESLVVVSDGDLNMPAFELAAQVRNLLGKQGQGPHLTVVGIAPRASEGAEQLLQSLANARGGSYVTEIAASGGEMVISSSTVTKPNAATR